ncbi:MAG: hypothetical protein ABIQ74_02875 [Chitinophagales bacterium]
MKFSRHFWFFILCLTSVLFIYLPSYQAGFVTDFYAWQYMFAGKTYLDALNTFSWHANQQFSALCMYLLYQVFKLNGWSWLIVFCFVHALNGFLLYNLFRKLLEKQGIPYPDLLSAIASLLFLLSPHAAEVLVWKVCFHYLLSGFFILSILFMALRYFETSRAIFMLGLYGFFFLSLLTLEVALITPLLVFALMIWLVTMENIQDASRKIMILIVPQFLMIAGYLLLNKLFLHDWMGHYGSDVHLKFNLPDVLSNYFSYLLKYLLFTRYFEHSVKMEIFGVTEPGTVQLILAIAAVLLLLLFFAFYRKISLQIRIAGWCWILFSVALFPVLTLYMVTLLIGENDRYGYFASMFFWLMMVMLFSTLPKKLFYGLCLIILVISVFLTLKTVMWWRDSARIYYSLLDDFRWYDRDQVIVLNIADNYHGLLMYRIYREPSALKEGLALIRHKEYKGSMYDVVNFNMMTPQDGVTVIKDSVNSLIMKFNQGGNWWWREGIGAGDYENDVYGMHIDGDVHIQFKSLLPNHAIIYQVGGKWKEVIMN